SMSVEIKVPTMGESVTEATIARWLKKPGEAVKQDEPVVELETDKVSVEVPSPVAGVIEEIRVQAGGTVNVGTVLGAVKEGAAPAAKPAPKAEAKPAQPAAQPAPAKAAPPPPPPSVKRIAEEQKLDPANVAGSGKQGQVLKGDMLAALAQRKVAPPASAPAPAVERKADAREERVVMSRLRKTIAVRLKES